MTGKGSATYRVASGIVWLGRFAKGWLPRTLGGVAALLLILWGALGDHVWKQVGLTLLIAGIAVAILAFFAEILVQQPSYMRLSQLREEAESRAAGKSQALERALRILLVRLGMHCELMGHSDRFSVYYFHEGEFVMIARHAKNPTNAGQGRMRYPADRGAISVAWSEPQGQVLVTMPSGNEAWKRAARKQGLTDEEIGRLKMRSLVLGGYRLEANEASVGVLVVESTTSNRITQTHLDQIASSHIVAAIGELVGAFAMMTPAGESIASAEPLKPRGKWKLVVPRVPFGPAIESKS
ncbi:hypothetical protein MN032_04460 [Agromyces atrinae]|uniref:hypothetical protein n=1 Tax=Agromyces atrinae TaxID=592376 RepID=UPI001F57ABB5|nr:hypothetical protein [Agromyces atrinae]MCI2956936.1 hypothetical protein [Agromyces atrinae]